MRGRSAEGAGRWVAAGCAPERHPSTMHQRRRWRLFDGWSEARLVEGGFFGAVLRPSVAHWRHVVARSVASRNETQRREHGEGRRDHLLGDRMADQTLHSYSICRQAFDVGFPQWEAGGGIAIRHGRRRTGDIPFSEDSGPFRGRTYRSCNR